MNWTKVIVTFDVDLTDQYGNKTKEVQLLEDGDIKYNLLNGNFDTFWFKCTPLKFEQQFDIKLSETPLNKYLLAI